MAGDTDTPESSATAAKQPALHPAYSVTNIQSKIRTLDGKTVTYTSWVKLFRLHAIAYKVLAHIDGIDPPKDNAPEYPLWVELDALVLQWILSTVSDNLLPRLLGQVSTARAAWLKLEKTFLSNKKARAAALETQFCNLTLAHCSSIDDYCQRLSDLANQLEDVDQPVAESRLVLQLVRGLPQEYDTTASLIHQNNADWDTARTMLQDEVIRMEARQSTTSSVLVTQQPNQTSSSSSQQPHNNHPNPNPNPYP
ncbi:hypothetical protein HanIR_Chr01g0043681 [Helianthus annuus]|nr:hypothetical protein HanIR_Chr01g0043681 [Helianthus annuus]